MSRVILRTARLRKPAIDAQIRSPMVPVACRAATFGKYSGCGGRISWATFRPGFLALKAGMNFSSCHLASSPWRKWTLTSPVALLGAAAAGLPAAVGAAAGAVVAAGAAAGLVDSAAGLAGSAAFGAAVGLAA